MTVTSLLGDELPSIRLDETYRFSDSHRAEREINFHSKEVRGGGPQVCARVKVVTTFKRKSCNSIHMLETRPESTVTDGFAASIPAVIRRKLGIEPGDKLVWDLTGAKLAVRVKKRSGRGFADFKPWDLGVTDVTEEHDEVF